jgi:hypothetical protein
MKLQGKLLPGRGSRTSRGNSRLIGFNDDNGRTTEDYSRIIVKEERVGKIVLFMETEHKDWKHSLDNHGKKSFPEIEAKIFARFVLAPLSIRFFSDWARF